MKPDAIRNDAHEQEIVAPLPGMIGSGPAMREVYRMVRLVAASKASVLIVGETGTGKELIARSIHTLSNRGDGPYVRINCGALSEGLLESELFGHVKGAFTGAIESKTGRFEAATGGTIFLDEISSMSHKLQVKLLRVLQEQEFERVGDHRTIRVDVRVVAATNQHLEDEIEGGRFRDDLYYRLNVVPIYLPPLQSRPGDAEQLAEFFARKYAAENNKRIHGFSPAAIQMIGRYTWPGNVRELENYVERAVIMCQGEMIEPEHLSSVLHGQPLNRVIRKKTPAVDASVEQLVRQAIQSDNDAGELYSQVVGAVEKELIEQVMIQCDRVQVKAASKLGINRNTLHKKIKEFKLPTGEENSDADSRHVDP